MEPSGQGRSRQGPDQDRLGAGCFQYGRQMLGGGAGGDDVIDNGDSWRWCAPDFEGLLEVFQTLGPTEAGLRWHGLGPLAELIVHRNPKLSAKSRGNHRGLVETTATVAAGMNRAGQKYIEPGSAIVTLRNFSTSRLISGQAIALSPWYLKRLIMVCPG
jgi:hypothetical protein